MKAEQVNPFLVEGYNIFKQVCQMELKVADKSIKEQPKTTKDVVVLVGITGQLNGNIAINFDKKTAIKI